jgi:glycosyltransferase involved in cell wall biosynthesis
MGGELARLGHQVHIATLHSAYDELQARESSLGGVKVSYVAPMHVRKQGSLKTYYSTAGLLAVTARATWQLTRQALTSEADIIHIGKPHPMNSLAGLAGKILGGRRLFLDCDDYEAGVGHFGSAWQKRGVVFFEDQMPFRAEHITTNTYFTRERLVGLGISPQRISYISNGIDRERFRPPDPASLDQLRAELGLEGRQVVAFIGSLSRPGHPVDLLFEAFELVHRQQAQSVLLVVGGGDDFPRLQQRAQDMGLGEAIRLCGRIPPELVARYYHLAHVSIDPVLEDDAARGRSPLKLFESWACGVPFVSCDVGDRRRLLSPQGDDHRLAGLLAAPGDANSLAEQILRVLQDKDLAAELAQTGRQRAEDYYWDVLTKDLERVYLSA